MKNLLRQKPTATRIDGYTPLADYGVLSDGRSIALVAKDGSIDWWCVPDTDAAPLFNRLLEADNGGAFALTPTEPFTIERHYREDSNVLRTVFITASGRVCLTESLNSGDAGRLPWCELARRLECLDGQMELQLTLHAGTQAGQASPWWQKTLNGQVLHAGSIMAMLCHDNFIKADPLDGSIFTASIQLKKGQQTIIALLATAHQPLLVPPLADIDHRIDVSDQAWRRWASDLKGEIANTGPYCSQVRRSALALKLLLHSPSGSIAAAATMGLPEKLGGPKNYDYRYGWVRDVAYTIKAFLRVGALSEPQAAFAWLMATVQRHWPELHVCYALSGNLVPDEAELDLSGYRHSKPVLLGNRAKHQVQLSIYGDILETAALFVQKGHLLDPASARLLTDLANRCADQWRQKDAGLWELADQQHYTMSKIGCWLALTRAAEMADQGHLPDSASTQHWRQQADQLAAWIDEHCWSEAKQAYVMHPGTDKLDASLLLASRFKFTRMDRLKLTRDAIRQELARGPLVYRYTGAEQEEGTFVACAFWLVEAYAFHGELAEARKILDELLTLVSGNLGLMSEQLDPDTHEMLGNLPQGLSHLAMIHAVSSLQENA